MTDKTLVLAHRHPANAYRLNTHIVTNVPQKFTLTDIEVKLLKTPEFKHWVKEISSKSKDKAILD